MHDEEFYSNQWPNIPALLKLKPPPPGPNCAGMAAATQVFCTSDSETVGGRQNAAEEKVDDSYVQQIDSPCKKNELLVLTIATFLFLKFKPFF